MDILNVRTIVFILVISMASIVDLYKRNENLNSEI
jgi:hypothetical protein